MGVKTALYCVCLSAGLKSTITQPELDFLRISGDKLERTHTRMQNLSGLQNHTLLAWQSFKPSAKGQGSNEKKAVYKAHQHKHSADGQPERVR